MNLRNRRLVLAGLMMTAVLVAVPTAATGVPADGTLFEGTDYTVEVVPPPDHIAAVETQGVLDDDPLRLIPQRPFVQKYSLDVDHFEVWLCGNTGYTMTQALAALNAATVDYFDAMSHGRYELEFTAGGTIPGDPFCLNGFDSGAYAPVGSPEGLFIIDSVTAGGFASPGLVCYGDPNCSWIGSTFPDNGRYAVVGAGALDDVPMVAAHELGHTLHWPHSNSGQSEYDNPIDLMSGNTAPGGWTYPDPYGSLSFNRYQSGWIDPTEVVVAGAVYQEITVQPYDVAGTQLIAVPTTQAGVFYALGARASSSFDPIPSEWEGVEVYLVDHDCGLSGFDNVCPGIFREHLQEPPNPGGVAHVLQAGENMSLNGVQISVKGRSGSGFIVGVGDPNNALPFTDIGSSAFVADILWLVDQSITKGCNPPLNSQYCPTSSVTRGEMAAFLVRALGLTDDGGGNTFTDDNESVFENDIAKLAAAGITKGCNPPDNTRFCPDARVTREQMAAFLVRAYALANDGGGNTFVDDDGSVFEGDIAKLAAAGVTLGCNPPANTMFCPSSSVTREQMAAFLHRASAIAK